MDSNFFSVQPDFAPEKKIAQTFLSFTKKLDKNVEISFELQKMFHFCSLFLVFHLYSIQLWGSTGGTEVNFS